jgi:hypothetical protein
MFVFFACLVQKKTLTSLPRRLNDKGYGFKNQLSFKNLPQTLFP